MQNPLYQSEMYKNLLLYSNFISNLQVSYFYA